MQRSCPHCNSITFSKKGSYFVKHSSSWIRRYLCLDCGKTFSSKTFSPTYRQLKPFLNLQIFHLITDGSSQRAASRFLNCSKNTVARKLLWLFKYKHALKHLNHAQKSSEVWMLDEMESIEHTKLKPLTIPLVVDDQYQIKAIGVGKIPAKGLLARISIHKYGYRENEREILLDQIFKELSAQKHPKKIITDGSSIYAKYIAKYLPTTKHEVVNAQSLLKEKREKIYSKAYKKIYDPMFALNQRCAKLRSDIKRLTRRSWCTTKKVENLKAHLELYRIKNNLMINLN